jgi:hypothetical protein
MKKFFWMLHCAYYFKRLGCNFRTSWECAAACWENRLDYGEHPKDAYLEEVSCWNE